ncbi:Eukaryotic translation initiation factor 3 subunit K [Venturia nashicola]|uniref:Eukaryotic translation initiation factor 3 subunit K n=1 Tax=Venturia nashicola TaxID=86259 RepID=A0A4Z1NUI0_9PEZI|nr:Eukaryotic translation initiation factor 3 subunit K [Venturia nashicola]
MATQETARTQFITANDIQFAYRLIGSPIIDKAPLLMLNHFRSNIDLWDPLLINSLVATGRQLITYDYAGMGHSNGEVESSIKAFSKNVIAFLHVLLPILQTSQVDVLGFSLGGYVAQQLALDAPTLVQKLVLAGTGPSFGPGLERPMAEVQSAIMAEPPDGNAIADTFFPSFVAREAGAVWLTSARQSIAGKEGEPDFAFFLGGDGLTKLTEAYLKWDADPIPYALLQTIQKDVFVTAGKNDLIVPTQNSFVLSRQLPRANFVVYPGSGHGHLFQFAEIYAGLVGSFLDGEWPVPPVSFGAISAQ